MAIIVFRCVIIRYLSHLNCYWNLIYCFVWVSNEYYCRLITCCRCVRCFLPHICCSVWKIIFVTNTIFGFWCFIQTYSLINRSWCIRILLWCNGYCYWDINRRTIWIGNSYNTWLVTWCRSIWCRLPCVICTIWKVTVITNTVLSNWLLLMPNCLSFGCWNNICCFLNWAWFGHNIILSWCLNSCFSCNISYWNLTCDDCSCFPICYSSCTNNSCSIWTIKSHDWTIFNSPSNRNSYWNVFLIRLTC